jgi:TolB-like protein/DNA-binding winged helix-turn-helix (wHTH) protein/Tfp pilus assembly protein PilF
MRNRANHFYEFGPYRLDPSRNLLRRGSETVPLTSKAFETLLVLIEHGDQIVSKEELMKQLWPDTFVEEANLAQHISMVRKALGETPQDRRYIITLPGRGYRFAERVRTLQACDEDSLPQSPGSTGVIDRVEPTVSSTRHNAASISFWKWLVATILASTLLAGGLYYRSRQSRTIVQDFVSHDGFAPAPKIMLAVLPFENLTGDPANDYFSDGLTEELITQLAELQPDQLGVIARTSVMSYKHGDRQVDRVATQLRVQYILEGSLRQSSGRVRISAQLIQVKDQTHLWAANYDRSLGDVLTLEQEVSGNVAREIQVELNSQRQANLARPRPIDPEAHELYLRGRHYWNERTQAGFWKAIELFRQAIEKDPSYARAYAGLADSYILLGPNDELPAKEVYPLAKMAAEKALQLDDALAEAHASLGFEMLLYDWNSSQAEKEFRRAIELDPNYATAYHWYAYDLVAMKRPDEGVVEVRHALELDPLSPIINTDLAQILMLARRTDEAIAQCEKTITVAPQFSQVYWYLGLLYEQEGNLDQAFEAFLKSPSGPSNTEQETAFRAAFRSSGIKGYWRERLAMLDKLSKDHYVSPWTFAVVYARMGEEDNAVESLEKAFNEHYPSVVFVPVEPVFDSLRSNPRFQLLLQRIRP